MRALYQAHKVDHLDKADGLRQAQLALLHGTDVGGTPDGTQRGLARQQNGAEHPGDLQDGSHGTLRAPVLLGAVHPDGKLAVTADQLVSCTLIRPAPKTLEQACATPRSRVPAAPLQEFLLAAAESVASCAILPTACAFGTILSNAPV